MESVCGLTPIILAVLLVNPFADDGGNPFVDAEPVVKAVSTSPAIVKAPLVITVSDTRFCPPCETAERVIVAKLAERGWKSGRHYRVVRSDEGASPRFAWKGQEFCPDGWPGWDAFSGELHAVMGVQPGGVAGATVGGGQRVGPPGLPPAVHSSLPPSVSFGFTPPAAPRVSIPPARRQWSYSGSNLAAHLAQSHGVNVPPGLSHAELVRLHSHAHEGTLGSVQGRLNQPAYASGYAYSQPVRRVLAAPVRMFCPSGNCPR